MAAGGDGIKGCYISTKSHLTEYILYSLHSIVYIGYHSLHSKAYTL